ncbi:hypothetical protein SAMN02745135_00459 [Caloranaerobacter azorensis DSM 13643]|uniref:Uncharacterized protein n=1 Tax=Caloranaerobacter azorensis DSM 13643 TaxID=1121264 RepID=A0A1M5S3B9_9FIRM|nr:hypothetical protein SAMN02745135_00459 [Caloranaerobacter azorensis DSM 13643]
MEKDLVYIKSVGDIPIPIPSSTYKKINEYIFSYGNILVKVTIINDKEPVSFEQQYAIAESVLNFLNNYNIDKKITIKLYQTPSNVFSEGV